MKNRNAHYLALVLLKKNNKIQAQKDFTMFKFFAAATIMAISLTSHAELLENGDFESAWDPETERGPGYIYNPDKTNSGLGWTFVGDSGLSKSGTAWHGVSPDNSQFAFIQRDYSSIQQTFSVAQDGVLELSFLWASRPRYNYGQNLMISLTNGKRTYVLDDIEVDTTEWTMSSINLGNVKSGDYTLVFFGYNDTDDDVAAFLDDVSISQTGYDISSGNLESNFSYVVPAPLSAGGILLAGIAFFRKKKKL